VLTDNLRYQGSVEKKASMDIDDRRGRIVLVQTGCMFPVPIDRSLILYEDWTGRGSSSGVNAGTMDHLRSICTHVGIIGEYIYTHHCLLLLSRQPNNQTRTIFLVLLT
jgi:hypothetical protein